jgi:hypothetical protein
MAYSPSITLPLARLSRLLAGALLLACMGGGLASAQRMLSVDPPVSLYRAQAGDTIDGVVTVANSGDTRARVRMALSDWRYLEDGSPEYPAAGTLERSVTPWITFNPAEVTLDANGKATIRYTIAVPKDAAAGSHWGVLFAVGVDPTPVPGVPLATFNVRVGHVIYVNVPPENPEGEITGIFGVPPKSPDGDYTLAIQYANTGNVAQRLNGYLELRNAAGKTLWHEEFPLRVTLPGETNVRLYHVLGPLPAGAYSALVVYNYGDPTKDVAGEYSFVLDTALTEPAPEVGRHPVAPGEAPTAGQ